MNIPNLESVQVSWFLHTCKVIRNLPFCEHFLCAKCQLPVQCYKKELMKFIERSFLAELYIIDMILVFINCSVIYEGLGWEWTPLASVWGSRRVSISAPRASSLDHTIRHEHSGGRRRESPFITRQWDPIAPACTSVWDASHAAKFYRSCTLMNVSQCNMHAIVYIVWYFASPPSPQIKHSVILYVVKCACFDVLVYHHHWRRGQTTNLQIHFV